MSNALERIVAVSTLLNAPHLCAVLWMLVFLPIQWRVVRNCENAVSLYYYFSVRFSALHCSCILSPISTILVSKRSALSEDNCYDFYCI